MTVTLISTPPAVVTPEQANQLQQNPPDSGLMPQITHHTQQNLDIDPSSLRGANRSIENQSEDEDRDEMIEMKFIPDDTSSLEAIFEALSECAALYPDKEYMEEDSDNELYGNGDNNEWITAAPSDEQELSEVGNASRAYLDSIIDQSNLTNLAEQQRTSPDTNEHEEMFEDADE
ncbi:15447_t:CDS:2 [Gigaspora rosea]|nr:15447_t:CDS:2 [Gigaspora rosea]